MSAANADFFILLAEDDENDVFLMKLALQKANIFNPMFIAEDGMQAIEYLKGVGKFADRKEYPLPSLLLTDLKMPIKNGFDLLQWVRHQPGLKTLPVVVLSASSLQKDVEMAYELGANAFLVKAFDIDELAVKLQNLITFWQQSVVLAHKPKS